MIQTLNEYKENGLLKVQKHPTFPLYVWNYTEKAQYNELWDDITLNHRCTIRDEQGKLIARSFSKFFNIEQKRFTPTDSFEIYDKADGSLGLLFYYQNEWVLASKGSFTSEQAVKGLQILQKYDYQALDKTLSYAFEIIYPENRIVVDYGVKEALVLLAVFDVDGKEYNIDNYGNVFECVKKYDFTEYETIKNLDWQNSEGFIVKFGNGDRCKVKFENYLELHRKLSNISIKAVWELICENRKITEFLDIIPDEYHKTVICWYENLLQDFTNIEVKVKTYFESIPQFESRKDFALYVKDYEHKDIMFSLLDGKNIKDKICKLIEPKNSTALLFEKEI